MVHLIFIADTPIPTPSQLEEQKTQRLPLISYEGVGCDSKKVCGLSDNTRGVRDMSLKAERWERSHWCVNVVTKHQARAVCQALF